MGLHASRVQNGELTDFTARPPVRFTIPDNHMDLFRGDGAANLTSTAHMVEAAGEYVEMNKHPGLKAREALARSSARRARQAGLTHAGAADLTQTGPVRPLTCPGLHIRVHPFSSTPTMGVRSPTRPSLPLPEWKDPRSTVEYEHQRPFASTFFEDPLKQPFVVGGVLPDSKGHFLETRGGGATLYSRRHADQALDALNEAPHRPTEWSTRNVTAFRSSSFAKARRDGVRDLPAGSALFTPTSQCMSATEVAAGDALRRQIAEIAAQRRKFQRRECGLSKASQRRQQREAAEAERRRQAREAAVASHAAEHDGHLLAYRIAFDAVDADGSGAVDADELAGALGHLGLRVREGDTVERLLAAYDADGNGTLDFAEFSRFAKDAMRDSAARPLFLTREQMLKHNK